GGQHGPQRAQHRGAGALRRKQLQRVGIRPRQPPRPPCAHRRRQAWPRNVRALAARPQDARQGFHRRDTARGPARGSRRTRTVEGRWVVVDASSCGFLPHNRGFMDAPSYSPASFEPQWAERWAAENPFTAAASAQRPKYYVLEMLP